MLELIWMRDNRIALTSCNVHGPTLHCQGAFKQHNRLHMEVSVCDSATQRTIATFQSSNAAHRFNTLH